MKAPLKIAFVISVLLNIFLALLVVKRTTAQTKATEIAKPFSVKNLEGSAPDRGYVVAFQDGKYWWTIDGDVLSMNAGVDQEVTLRLEKGSGRVKSTTIELYDATDVHCYFTDFNADGIPDKKRIGSDENWQIFYDTKFVPSFAKGTNRYILQNGTNLLVRFEGGRWNAIK